MNEKLSEAVSYIFADEINARVEERTDQLNIDMKRLEADKKRLEAEKKRLEEEKEAEKKRLEEEKEAEKKRLEEEKEAEMANTIKNMLLASVSISQIIEWTNTPFKMVDKIARSLGMSVVAKKM